MIYLSLVTPYIEHQRIKAMKAENIQVNHEVSPETFQIRASSIVFDITSEALYNSDWQIHCRAELPGPEPEKGVYFYTRVNGGSWGVYDQDLSDYKESLSLEGFSYNEIVSFGNEVIRKICSSLNLNLPF